MVVPEERLPEPLEVALYYVAAETLVNIAKFAQADRVELTLTVSDREAALSIVDNGIGGALLEDGGGLAGLTDRLEAVGGGLTVESPPGEGTTVHAVVPLDEPVGFPTRIWRPIPCRDEGLCPTICGVHEDPTEEEACFTQEMSSRTRSPASGSPSFRLRLRPTASS